MKNLTTSPVDAYSAHGKINVVNNIVCTPSTSHIDTLAPHLQRWSLKPTNDLNSDTFRYAGGEHDSAVQLPSELQIGRGMVSSAACMML